MNQLTPTLKLKTNKNLTGTEAIRVKKETKKKIQSLLLTINKKDFGQKVKIDDLICVALNLLTKEHHTKLQELSFTNKDRLEMQFKEYQLSNEKVSKDEFIGLLLSGKIELKKVSNSSIGAGKTSEDLI